MFENRVLERVFGTRMDEVMGGGGLHNEELHGVYSPPYIIFTYLLTPWCRILFEKLIITHLVENILSYGTRRFTTVFTKAHHWTLS
jgi:hypothetical protein